MTREEFEKLVRLSLRTLPKAFKERLRNIEIVVEAGRSSSRTLGLYQGVPLTQRGQGYSLVLPDKITLFQRAIEEECKATGADIRAEIRDVVRHEIAHHFGISDERLENLGIY